MFHLSLSGCVHLHVFREFRGTRREKCSLKLNLLDVSDILHSGGLTKTTEMFTSDSYRPNSVISHEQMESLIELKKCW